LFSRNRQDWRTFCHDWTSCFVRCCTCFVCEILSLLVSSDIFKRIALQVWKGLTTCLILTLSISVQIVCQNCVLKISLHSLFSTRFTLPKISFAQSKVWEDWLLFHCFGKSSFLSSAFSYPFLSLLVSFSFFCSSVAVLSLLHISSLVSALFCLLSFSHFLSILHCQSLLFFCG
jgi:hypothetical protein